MHTVFVAFKYNRGASSFGWNNKLVFDVFTLMSYALMDIRFYVGSLNDYNLGGIYALPTSLMAICESSSGVCLVRIGLVYFFFGFFGTGFGISDLCIFVVWYEWRCTTRFP